MDNEKMKPSAWFFAEWISIISLLLTCFVFLFYQNQVQAARSDKLYETFYSQIKDQSARTDKLYEMFIDLLKEGKR